MTDTLRADPAGPALREPATVGLSRDIHILSNPAGPQAESIRVLRTYLAAQHLRDGRRSLAICSPAADVGCSYLAVNLAVATAQTGVKTLLIDADMRRGGLDRYLVPDQPVNGLYQLLSDPHLPVHDAVVEVQPNLSVLFAGARTPNAQELLGGAGLKALIDGCVRDYDLTIVDTPPGNQFADARRIASVLRYALVVTRRHRTYVKDLRTMIGELEGDRVRVVGTYLNDF